MTASKAAELLYNEGKVLQYGICRYRKSTVVERLVDIVSSDFGPKEN